MQIKYYGLYDGVAKNMVNIFTAQNDEVCLRSCESIVKDPKTDVRLLKDCIVQYLYTVDSESGDVVDVSKHDIVAMSSIIDNADINVSEESFIELRNGFQLIQKQFEGYKELDKKCQSILDLFASRMDSINKKVDDIIGGKIKCQKYKKTR